MRVEILSFAELVPLANAGGVGAHPAVRCRSEHSLLDGSVETMDVTSPLGARRMHLLPRPLYVLSVLIEDSKYVGGIAHAERIVRKEDVRNIIVSASCCDEAFLSLSYLACTLPTTLERWRQGCGRLSERERC